MNYFQIFKYNDNVYQIRDSISVLSTLVIGENKALIFDTCYGIGDLLAEVKKLTDKPLIVVNSHGHMDHSCGNYQFSKVYITKDDYELCLKHNNKDRRMRNVKAALDKKVLPVDFDVEKYINQPAGNFEFLNIGDIYDLGGLTLTVVALEGHTKGSIGLLINEQRILLASDALGPFVWLFLEESTTVSEYIKMCYRTFELPFDHFLGGHIPTLMGKEELKKFIDVAEKIDLKESEKVVFQNFEELDSYAYSINGKIYSPGSTGILFDPKKL